MTRQAKKIKEPAPKRTRVKVFGNDHYLEDSKTYLWCVSRYDWEYNDSYYYTTEGGGMFPSRGFYMADQAVEHIRQRCLQGIQNGDYDDMPEYFSEHERYQDWFVENRKAFNAALKIWKGWNSELPRGSEHPDPPDSLSAWAEIEEKPWPKGLPGEFYERLVDVLAPVFFTAVPLEVQ